MNILAPQAETPKVEVRSASRHFHVFMACACLIILAFSVLGCSLTSIQARGIGRHAVAVLSVVAILLPWRAYWRQKGRSALGDAAFTIPWAFLLFELLPIPILIGARLRMPLRDTLLAHIDRSLGISVPGIMVWARGHWIGPVLAHTYDLLAPLMFVAIIAPALAGKAQQAKEFLVANVVAFAIAVPTFALLPAVGPWYFYGLAADPAQDFCQRQLLALRLPGSTHPWHRDRESSVSHPSMSYGLFSVRPLYGDSGRCACRSWCCPR